MTGPVGPRGPVGSRGRPGGPPGPRPAPREPAYRKPVYREPVLVAPGPDQPYAGPGMGPRRGLPRWLRGAAFLVAVVLLLAVTVWVFAISSLLGVRTVTVKGAALVTAEQVRQAAGLRTGEPLIRVDRAAVRARVGALAEVRSVAVRLSYPRTVVITIAERQPVGYTRTVSGELSLIDVTAQTFRSVPAPPPGLPEVVAAAKAARAAACAVSAVLPEAVRAQVRSIGAESASRIVLTLADERQVIWGGAERSAEKARLLPALLGQEGSQFDVSTPGMVVVR